MADGIGVKQKQLPAAPTETLRWAVRGRTVNRSNENQRHCESPPPAAAIHLMKVAPQQNNRLCEEGGSPTRQSGT